MHDATVPRRTSSKLDKTKTPGVYRRHVTHCPREGRCKCPYVLVTTHRGKQTKQAFASYKAACEAKGDRTGTDRKAPAARTPFEDYARAWIASNQGRTARGFDDDTRKSYGRALELYAIPHFGRTPLRDIERRDIDKLITKLQRQRRELSAVTIARLRRDGLSDAEIDKRRKGLSATTIAKYLAPVRAMFADAVERGDMSVNPALRLRINAKAQRSAVDAEEHEREKTITRAELHAILTEVPEDWRLLFELLAGTGCRISEALGLDWTDVGSDGDHTTLRIERQWYRGTLKPNAKTEAGERTIDLDAALAAKLWQRGADAAGPMFATRSGTRLNDRNLRRVLDAACQRAGVSGVGFHTFRHTHGSMLIDDGWTIPEVSERLGHADPAITARVYAHAQRDRRRVVPSFRNSIESPAAAS